ncbi:hypothetical protein F2Q68_00039129 [Brassica cretica]|uniref:Uncharacterized protein n=1 Tax=Brassica cretica TaxID=69181 RepID=A0A8S9MPH6_BRACR|nr:hypothetical protein F2Q68_00039129 [Brassica cretica]
MQGFSNKYLELQVPLCWRDGPAANGGLARTLLLLEQRHLDTLAQMAVGMAGVRPRADAAEVHQVAGPCSVAAWSLGLGGGVGQGGTNDVKAMVKVRECLKWQPHQVRVVLIPEAPVAVFLEPLGAREPGTRLGRRTASVRWKPSITHCRICCLVVLRVLDRMVSACRALRRFVCVLEVVKELDRFVLTLSRQRVFVTDWSRAAAVKSSFRSPFVGL